MRLNESQI